MIVIEGSRRVEWFDYEQPEDKKHYVKVEKGSALLLDFGVDYEQVDLCVGTFSTAIIMLDNGEVKNIPVENIKFMTCTVNDEA